MVISADISARDSQGLNAGERLAIQETAQSFGAILVLARPDERLRQIQARPDTTPARATLTALAADRDAGARQIQHFVVDRGAVPEAFSASRSAAAETAWERLLASHGASSSEELNQRNRKGLTPYSVDLKPRSETFGVLKDRGRLVHAGLALRDVIAVPIYVDDDDSDWEAEIVTVSASRQSVADVLGARLNQRVEVSSAEAEAVDTEVSATAYTPALQSDSESGSILAVSLSSLGDLRELRGFVGHLRTLRESLAGGTDQLSTMGELRSVALASRTGMISP